MFRSLLKLVTVLLLLFGSVFFSIWFYTTVNNPTNWQFNAFRLRGDSAVMFLPQKRRIVQALDRLHGATVLSGRSYWSYNECPAAVTFSGNRCYIAWYFQEYQTGHGGYDGSDGEAEYRNRMSNDFFDGKLPDPLGFLRSNNIAAVVVWPDDDPTQAVTDDQLAKLQSEIGSEYFYLDCRPGSTNYENAGVFFRESAPSPATVVPPSPPATATPPPTAPPTTPPTPK